MAVALVAKNKTKISFFLCTNFLLFYRHKHFPTRALPQMHLEVHRIPPDDQMFTRALCTLLSFHLNNQSIKKALFRPLNLSFYTILKLNFWNFAKSFIKKIKNYFSYRDPIPDDLKSFLVCKFTCASCSSSYIGKTCHHFKIRIKEHIKRIISLIILNIYTPPQHALIDIILFLVK